MRNLDDTVGKAGVYYSLKLQKPALMNIHEGYVLSYYEDVLKAVKNGDTEAKAQLAVIREVAEERGIDLPVHEEPATEYHMVGILLEKDPGGEAYGKIAENMLPEELDEALEVETRPEGLRLLKTVAGLIEEEPEPEPVAAAGAQMVPIEKLYPNPANPRKRFDEEELGKLTSSIRQVGILSPIIVIRDGEKYRIVAGERRYRAAKAAGFEEVPVLVRELSEAEEFEVMLTENLQREDLDPIEEAEAYTEAVSRGWKQTELGERLGISQAQVANRLRLLKLPEEVQEDISREILSAGHGLALVKVAHVPGAVEEIKNTLVEENVSVADALKEVDNYIATKGTPLHKHTYSPPQFDVNKICLKSKCKMRLYGKRKYETIDEPYCVDPDCWVKHQEAARAAEIEKQARDVLGENADGSSIPRLRDLEINEYEYFNPNVKIEDCAGCEHIVGALDYADELVKVCTDPECFKQKRNAVYEERLRKKQAEQDAFKQQKAGAVSAFTTFSRKDAVFIAARAVELAEWIAHSENVKIMLCEELGIDVDTEMDMTYEDDYALFEQLVERFEKMTVTELYKLTFRMLLHAVGSDDDSWRLTLGADKPEQEGEAS